MKLMKRRKFVNNKKRVMYFSLFFMLLLISVGYAYLNSTLSINGHTEIGANTWNIHFANLSVDSGSVSATTPATIQNDTTIINYSVSLSTPGDYYAFSVDVVNSGSLNGELSLVDIGGITSEISQYLTVDIEYDVIGEEVEVGDILRSGSTKRINVKVMYRDDIPIGNYPSESITANLSFNLTYVQTNKISNSCTFNGTLVQGAEFVKGQYKYEYKREYENNYWSNIAEDGWGVAVVNPNSEDPIITDLCTSINGKPIVSMSSMFYNSQAPSIDFSSFDTSNVKYMRYMFYNTFATELDLSSFDTSNVTEMRAMFYISRATEINLSSFNTSNVDNMMDMFHDCFATELDLSSFDTSNVVSMYSMFDGSQATQINLSSFNTENVLTMENMFTSSRVQQLDLSNFSAARNPYVVGMFCLRGVNGVTFGSDFPYQLEMDSNCVF